MNYTHLSQKERDQLFVLLQAGHSKRAVARILQRNISSIVREVRRNSTSLDRKYNHSPKIQKMYLPDRAQQKYEWRRNHAKTVFPLKKPWIYRYVLQKLKKDWSPEIISGKIAMDLEENISHECIYQFIYSERGKSLKLWQYLVRGHIKRRKYHGRKGRRTLIPNRKDIDLRPDEVETRKVPGHWEGDSVLGIGRGSALHTEVERTSRHLEMRKILRKTAKLVSEKMIQIFSNIPQEMRKSSTLDNGCEHTEHERVTEKTGIDIYFAHPYHSWERGSNEQVNGLIRRYFPKHTDFDLVSEEEIYAVQEHINNRPRKCLDWKTPNEVYYDILSSLKQLKAECCT